MKKKGLTKITHSNTQTINNSLKANYQKTKRSKDTKNKSYKTKHHKSTIIYK